MRGGCYRVSIRWSKRKHPKRDMTAALHTGDTYNSTRTTTERRISIHLASDTRHVHPDSVTFELVASQAEDTQVGQLPDGLGYRA